MKTTELKVKETLKENEKVLNFIIDWESKNEYKKESLKKYNYRFTKEFNFFLNNNNFSKDTIELFQI